MGIISSIIGRIGLPILAVSVAGFLLFTFRDRILGAIGGGAEVVGQAITQPFGSFLQGVQQGFAQIPEQIQFRLPSFDFIFGQSDPNNDPLGQLQMDFDNFFQNFTNFFSGGGGSPTLPPPPVIDTTALTPFRQEFITTTQSGVDVNFRTETLEEILARNQNAVALFDFKGTTDVTEFFALTAEEIKFFGAENLIFSGQLFNEITNIEEALAFA